LTNEMQNARTKNLRKKSGKVRRWETENKIGKTGIQFGRFNTW